MTKLIERRLYSREDREMRSHTQGDVVGMDAPAVVLGEAGMGKTRLLEWIGGQPGHVFCTARQLINRPDPRSILGNGTTLVIDALDEVVSRREGDAVDLVLQKLGALDYPRFVLSCRVADWQSATSVAAIREQYAERPRELHLEPFTEEDARTFLADRLSAERAVEVIEHFNDNGLHGFLGNPQTLEMIERVAPTGELPRTSTELFARTIDIIWSEHRDEKAVAELNRANSLDAAGAAFAALLLTGSEAISRRAAANLDEGELALAEVEAFDSGRVNMVFGTRLFRSVGADRFSYWHRRIGEYLAAQWLSARADTRAKRRRLISMFQGDGLVPSSLRGVHAWLALDPHLAPTVIEADPMGVIEYGDADVLEQDHSRILMQSLRRVASEDPRFRNRGPYRARSLVQAAFLPDVRAAITDPATPFGLKLLLLEQLERADTAVDLADELKALMLDPEQTFAERSSAGDALRQLEEQPDWPDLVDRIRSLADSSSTRLAVELLGEVGFDAFSDLQIAEVVLAHSGLSLQRRERERRDRTIGSYTAVRRGMPVDRLEGVLDIVTPYIAALTERDHGGPDELTDVVTDLITRKVTAGGVTPEQLWRWISSICEENGYSRRGRQSLSDALRSDDALRRGVQKLALLDADDAHDIWRRSMRLGRRASALSPSEGDVVALMAELDPADRTDTRWRDLLELLIHDPEKGKDARAAALPFAAHRPDLVDWIGRLPEPRIPEWQKREEKDKLKREARKATKFLEHRKGYTLQLPEMRSGGYGALVNPAKAYMGRFNDIGEDSAPHQRINGWLGPKIADAAHAGFESFLYLQPVKPTATEIAHSLAESRSWDAGDIIVAAMAERLRTGRGLADLPAERMMAAWLELRNQSDEHAGLPGLRNALIEELKRRRKWRSALILLIEPQLKAGNDHVVGLYEFTHDEADADLAVDLALGWLRRIETMAGTPEGELIARVVASNRRDELKAIAASRLARSDLDDERRSSWIALQILIDFDSVTPTEIAA